MCVIIDASVAARAFAVPCEDDFAPLWRWIEDNSGKLVFGGRLGLELNKLGNVKRRLLQLWRAGRALQASKTEIDAEAKVVEKLDMCRSNDAPVIALARASGARVLCTNDQDLETDFKNRELVPDPRGRIYKTANHERLLGHNGICIGRPRRRSRRRSSR